MPKSIANWLKGLGCTDLVPVLVTIGHETWVGCRYTQTHHYTAEMQAVISGQHKAGDKYVNDRIYVVGRLPATKLKGHVCFPFEGKDWYVAGYYQESNPKYDKFHPYGLNFILAPWDIPNSKIDEYEPKPYWRIDMLVEPVKA